MASHDRESEENVFIQFPPLIEDEFQSGNEEAIRADSRTTGMTVEKASKKRGKGKMQRCNNGDSTTERSMRRSGFPYDSRGRL
jgi:hypothetical protein